MDNVPPLNPYLSVSNAAAAIEFYKKAFGAEETSRHFLPGTTKIMHAQLTINEGIIMLSDDFSAESGGISTTPEALGGSPVTIHMQLTDVDALWNKAVAAGATVLMPLADQFWGDRYGLLKDPFGHKWSLAQTKTHPTAVELEEGAKKAFGTTK
ncbi:MAG TPA: VOC family protein [Edaphobacter sp.]